MPDSPSPDPLAVALAVIREDLRVTADLERLGGYKTHTAALRHATALLAVVEAALKAHCPSHGRCCLCRDPDGGRQKWPCGEYLTITAGLTGKDSTDD